MSWWVCLTDEDGESLEVPAHEEGGTYALGGLPFAELNITYNYSKHYYKYLNEKEGLRWLDGKRAKDTITMLDYAVGNLGVKRSSDYWNATRGNAGYALRILLQWANKHPEGIWRVS